MLVTLFKTFDSSTQFHTLANISQVHLIICLVTNYGVGPNAREWRLGQTPAPMASSFATTAPAIVCGLELNAIGRGVFRVTKTP